MTLFPARNPKDSISEQEQSILKFWKEENVFQRTIDSRSPHNEFRFFDGPPFATGKPHYGHLVGGTIKDCVPRYWTMKGHRVARKFGWDCHGLPVEFQVEKEYDLKGKEGIEEMGVGKFNETCRSIVMRCEQDWKEVVDRMGRFIDFDGGYKTMDPTFMESVWSVFGRLWAKELVYEGYKVVSYSPKLGSSLSNFEANLNYKDIDDPAVTVKFELVNEPGTFFLAWTTTPWTLPSNVGVGMGLNHEYVLIEQDGERYWLAEAAAGRYFDEGWEDKVVGRKLGKEFLNTHYKPLFPWFAQEKESRFFAIHDDGDYVSTSDGTGIVHFAPFFGEEDEKICTKFGLKGVNPIDDAGYFTSVTPELEGKYFRSDPEVEGSAENNVNEWVINALKENGNLFKREQIRHSYPHCWRTECALMYRGVDTWFIKVQNVKDRMLELNEDINWKPGHLKHGRFGKIVETAPDWAISRSRYWGTPIPIWRCDKTGEVQIVSSVKELEKLSGEKVTDLHKHFVDELTWKNEKTGGMMVRIPEVFDCWVESGSMPYASTHYPFSLNEKKNNDAPEVYVVRHGQSDNNVFGIESCQMETQTKFGLVPPGFEQVEASAKELRSKGIEFDVILSSPFRRTIETAEVFAKVLGGELLVDERLKEYNLGPELDMIPYGDAAQVIHTKRKYDEPFEGGESAADMEVRLTAVLEEVIAEYPGKKVLLVSHGSPITSLEQVCANEKVKLGDMKDLPANAEVRVLDLSRFLPEVEAVGLQTNEDLWGPLDKNVQASGGPGTESGVADFQPADFIAEGMDQTRCWFYVLHVLGTALFDKAVYKNVITNGIVLAEDGAKMSKSKQNYPDPMEVINKYGADAMRYYLMSSPVAKGENLRFAEKGVEEVLKSVILPLKSAYQFFSTYATLDKWKPTQFVLARHGEADHNLQYIYSGNKKNPHFLTEKGKKQVREMAKGIPHLDALYFSPFERTKQTKDIMLKNITHRGKGVEDDRLVEADFGELEGKKLIGRHDRFNGDYKAESLESMMTRAESFVSEMKEKHRGKTIGVVSHGDMFALFHMLNNGLSSKDTESFVKIPFVSPGKAWAYFATPEPKTELDTWILSETQTLLEVYREKMDNYDLEAALQVIPPFIEKLNNWYLRRSRKRFWATGMNEEKASGYEALHYVLMTLSKVLAPICPFYADQLFQDLGGLDSVHVDYFPHALPELKSESVAEKIELEREIASLAAGIRAEKKIKLRQPLGKVQFYTTSKIKIDTEIIAQEANVKEVEMISSLEGIACSIVRVDARKVGKKFGKKVQELIKAGKEGAFKELEGGAVEVAGERLEPGEFEPSFICSEGMEAAATVRTVVLVDTTITPELECEGVAREIIRSIQDMRKSKGFEVSDRITISYSTALEKLKEAFMVHESMILEEVLGVGLKNEKRGEEIEIDGDKIRLQISVVK